MNLGEAIKGLRQIKGYNQNKFADLCELSQTYLSQIENNIKEPNMSTLRIISEKLGVPLPFLFFLSLDESDIKPEKLVAYNHIEPSLKLMVKELFTKANKND